MGCVSSMATPRARSIAPRAQTVMQYSRVASRATQLCLKYAQTCVALHCAIRVHQIAIANGAHHA